MDLQMAPVDISQVFINRQYKYSFFPQFLANKNRLSKFCYGVYLIFFYLIIVISKKGSVVRIRLSSFRQSFLLIWCFPDIVPWRAIAAYHEIQVIITGVSATDLHRILPDHLPVMTRHRILFSNLVRILDRFTVIIAFFVSEPLDSFAIRKYPRYPSKDSPP